MANDADAKKRWGAWIGAAALVIWGGFVVFEYHGRHQHILVTDSLGEGVPSALFVALLITAAATSFGVGMVRRFFTIAAPETRILVGFAIGSGTLGWIVFALAWAGVLHGTLVWLVLMAGLFSGLGALASEVRALFARRPKTLFAPAYALGFLGLLFFLAALTPPQEWDELAYHLPLAVQAAETGRAPLAGHDFSYYPQLCESLTAAGLALGASVRVGRVLHFMFASALGGVVFVATRELVPKGRAPWLALAILIVEPLFVATASIAGVDLALSFYAVLAVWLIQRTDVNARTGFLVGILAGFACGTTYRGVLVAVSLGATLLVARRWRWLGVFAAGAVLGAAPWYLRNLIATGNPMYPFLSSIFHTTPLPTAFTALGWPAPELHPHVAIADPIDSTDRIVRIFRLPWDATIVGRSHTHGRFDGSLSPLYLALTPMIAFVRFRDVKKPLVLWTCFAFVHSVLWAVSPSAHGTRYQLPVVAVAALTIPAVIELLRWRALRVATTGVAIVVSALLYVGAVAHRDSRLDLFAVTGLLSTRDYLRKSGDAPLYEFIFTLNREPPTSGPVLMIGDKRTLYFTRPVIPDFELDNVGALYRNGGRNPDGMAELLRHSGIRHIIEHSLMAADGMNAEEKAAYAEMVARHTKVRSQTSYMVWREIKD